MNELKNRFAERLKVALEESDLSQRALAKALDVAPPTVNQYLRGSYMPKQNRLVAMANVLNVNVSWLQGYDAAKDTLKKKVDDIEDYLEKYSEDILDEDELYGMEIDSLKLELIERFSEHLDEVSHQQLYNLNKSLEQLVTIDARDLKLLILFNKLKKEAQEKMIIYGCDMNLISENVKKDFR